MANKKISEMTELASTPSSGDLIEIVDVADTSEAATGTNKKVLYSNLVPTQPAASTTTAGIVELSTDAEAIAKSDTGRAITPSNVAALFIDEDSMATDSATRMPSQQSVKAYVDTHASDTTTHGTTGNIVGTSDSQTLTNKTLTNPIINYTDTTIGVNVKARAARTTNQSIADATATKLTLDTETYDVGGDFDAVTNYRFTAPVTGYYMICAQVNYASAADGSVEQLDIRKNGSDLVRATGRASGTGNASVNLSDIVLLTATDYIELWFTHGTGAGENCTGFMSVHLLSV